MEWRESRFRTETENCKRHVGGVVLFSNMDKVTETWEQRARAIPSLEKWNKGKKQKVEKQQK